MRNNHLPTNSLKKCIAWIIILLFALSLSACSNTKEDSLMVFSFCGENEQFQVSNGVIVIGDTVGVFDGGDLEVIQPELFSAVASYSVTFYTTRNGEQRILLSNSAVDTTGNPINIEGDLGRITGDDFLAENHPKLIDELKQNLWLEIKTTDLNGNKNTYQISLHLTEITDTLTK